MKSARSEVFTVPLPGPGIPQVYIGERKHVRRVKRITVFPREQYAASAEMSNVPAVFVEARLAQLFLVFCDKDGEVLLKDAPATMFVNTVKAVTPAAGVPKRRLDVADLPISPAKSYAVSTTGFPGTLMLQFEYSDSE